MAAIEHSYLQRGGSHGFEPLAVDPDLDVVYGRDVKDGYTALYRRALTEGAPNELLLSHPGVDVDNLVRVGRQQRVVGVSYATEKRVVDYADPELAKLSKAMVKVFPAGSAVNIIDATQNEQKLVMLVTSDVNPGMLYLYDKATHQMAELLPLRPQLAGVALSQMKPVRFPARDGTMIPGYLTLPPGSDGKTFPPLLCLMAGRNRVTSGASTGCRNSSRTGVMRCCSPNSAGRQVTGRPGSRRMASSHGPPPSGM
jgi:dipeptidyl aminopeptidase/acylaminoacyl peptidase